MPVFGLVFSPSLAFLVQLDTILGVLRWLGKGGSDNPQPHNTVEGKKYIVKPGIQTQLKGGFWRLRTQV